MNPMTTIDDYHQRTKHALPSRWAEQATPGLIERAAQTVGMNLANKQAQAVRMALTSRSRP